jgi:integrase
MSEIRVIPWRRKWALDYRDTLGRRHRPSFESEAGAHAEADRLRSSIYGPRYTRRDSEVTIREYAGSWLRFMGALVKPSTQRSYEGVLRLHIVPALGGVRLVELNRAAVKRFIADKLAAGLSRNTVRLIRAVLRGLLAEAVGDGILASNAAADIGRRGTLRHLTPSESERALRVKAMTQEQLGRFLEAARTVTPGHHLLFLILAKTGLRLGEALALESSAVDYGRRVIHVRRNVTRGYVGTPKSGRDRHVDMSRGASDALEAHELALRKRALRQGVMKPDLVFPSRSWTMRDGVNVGRAFRRALATAALPDHFSPHSLRHTYACHMLAAGADVHYLQQQLGHADIRLTVSLYGKWLRRENPGIVDRLDEAPRGDRPIQARNTRSMLRLV